MGKIISSDKAAEYKIEKFEFGDAFASTKNDLTVKNIFSQSSTDDMIEKKNDDIPITKDNEEFENLLKKVDSLTSEVASLQMKIEEQKKEFEKQLLEEKEKSYHDGVRETTESLQSEVEDLKVQYISSVTNLQELELDIKDKLKQFEEELIETSIIIAQKVIKKEVEENSSKIAVSISKYLLSDIKESVQVKLLVNPLDFDELLNSNLKDNVKVMSDNSIKRGGVVIMTDKQNIDGTVETRYKKTLQLIKES